MNQDEDSLLDMDSTKNGYLKKEFYLKINPTNQFSFDVPVSTKFEPLHHQMLMQIVMVMLDAMTHNSQYVYDLQIPLLDVLVGDAINKLSNLFEIIKNFKEKFDSIILTFTTTCDKFFIWSTECCMIDIMTLGYTLIFPN